MLMQFLIMLTERRKIIMISNGLYRMSLMHHLKCNTIMKPETFFKKFSTTCFGPYGHHQVLDYCGAETAVLSWSSTGSSFPADS
jgi:hypothetical protein